MVLRKLWCSMSLNVVLNVTFLEVTAQKKGKKHYAVTRMKDALAIFSIISNFKLPSFGFLALGLCFDTIFTIGAEIRPKASTDSPISRNYFWGIRGNQH